MPGLPDPQRRHYLVQVAALMDDRKQRIGQFAADNALPLAVTALGPVPDDITARAEWQKKASSIGAYRETYAHDHPRDAIGPEPTCRAPDQAARQRGVPARGLDRPLGTA